MKKIVIKEKDLYNISPLLKGVMNLAFDESCIMDKDGYIIHCSDSSPLIWNRPNEESIGMHISELDSASPYPELLETGKAVMGKIHIINGRTCITHMIPLFDKNNNILGAFGVIIFRGIEKLKNLVRENVFDDESISIFDQLSKAEASHSFDDIITNDPKMKELIRNAKRAALSEYNILIHGETGTGKELLAHSIHTYKTRAEHRPFVRINCNAIPTASFEQEMFGYERGAFAGAYSTRPGKFEIAGNGTILLDEIGSLDTNTQAKLLRVLEEKEFERVGGNTLVPLKARIIATTNENIKQKVADNQFRRDLYYRLSTLELNVPPLRERPHDLNDLMELFITETGKPYTVTPDASAWLKQYSWPGNVRQLKNLITRISVMDDSETITTEIIRKYLEEELGSIYIDNLPENETAKDLRDNLDKNMLLTTLEETHYNISKTAELLELSRNTVYSRMQKYGIEKK